MYTVYMYPGQHLCPFMPNKAAGQRHMGIHRTRNTPIAAPICMQLFALVSGNVSTKARTDQILRQTSGQYPQSVV